MKNFEEILGIENHWNWIDWKVWEIWDEKWEIEKLEVLHWDVTSHWSEWPSHTHTNKTKNKCWQGYGKKQNPCTLLVGIWTGAAKVKNSIEVSQKRKKIELPYNPAILLLGGIKKQNTEH